MPTWLKVVLIVGGLLLVLFVASLVGLFFLAKKYVPEMVEAGKQNIEEGRRVGRLTDNEGCVAEAVTRHKHAEGIGDLFKGPFFLQACLEASRPTPGFCDDVPDRLEFMKSAHWQLDECKRYGFKPESQCGQLFQQVQQFCERKHRTDTQDSEPPPPPAPPEPPAPPRSK